MLKPAKQILLSHKQKSPHIFQDICLYSEVCKLVWQNSYRLGPRRLIQELFFDVNFETLHSGLNSIIANQNRRQSVTSKDTIRADKTPSVTTPYSCSMDAIVARRIELSPRQSTVIVHSNKNVKRGFNVETQQQVDSKIAETYNTITFDTRSPPLQMVAEEGILGTENNENLLTESSCNKHTTTSTNKTDIKPTQVLTNRKSLDSIKFTYNENKFPIKNRDDKNVIK